MKKLSLLFLVLFCCSCLTSINVVEMEQNLQSVIDRERLAGFGVAVFNKDSVFYSKGFGFSNVEEGKTYTTNTCQQLASVSKTFIGFALAKCQELGLLKITDPVNAYLPFEVINPWFPNEPITIKHLATHTATFKYSERMTDEINYAYPDSSLLFFTENYFSKNGNWYSEQNFHPNKPGEIWDYSNMGATLAALVVEQASDMNYSDFLKTYLFKPLGNLHTAPFDRKSQRSFHYELDSLRGFREVKQNPMGIYPAGDYLSSVNEMVTFYQMVMNGGIQNGKRLLRQSLIEEMLAPQEKKGIIKLDAEHYNHGLYWMHDKNVLGNPKRVNGHIGGNWGVFTSVWYEPKSGLGYVLLSNTGRDAANFDAIIYIWQSLYRYSKRIR